MARHLRRSNECLIEPAAPAFLRDVVRTGCVVLGYAIPSRTLAEHLGERCAVDPRRTSKSAAGRRNGRRPEPSASPRLAHESR